MQFPLRLRLLLLGICLLTGKLSLAQSDALEPKLFLPELLASPQNNRDLAISPDGNLLLSTLVTAKGAFSVIVIRRKTSTGWSEAELAPFSGRYPDLEPAFSPDGKNLFFASNRPLEGETEIGDYNIWKVDISGDHWSDAQSLGAPVNTEEDEFYPSIAASGNLYFTSQQEGGQNQEDIFVAIWKDGGYEQPKALGDGVNSATYEFNAWVSPTEDLLIFSSYGRPDGLGGGDLYLSRMTPSGEWGQAQPLAAGINSSALDYCPFVSWNGKTFYFSSDRSTIRKYYDKALSLPDFYELLEQPQNGNKNIYSIDASVLEE